MAKNKGRSSRKTKSKKGVKLTSRYAKIIVEFWRYVKDKLQTGYLFPAGTSLFGEGYVVDDSQHIGERTLLNTVKQLNPSVWTHLFRELKGADVTKQYGRSLESVYQVKDALDLESEQIAYHYVKRFVVNEMKI